MEDIITAERGTELVQAESSLADSVGPSEEEQRLADEIGQLWEGHAQAKTTVTKTKEELKAIRELLSERLYELKQLLARPGRCGQWSSWLKERKISRAAPGPQSEVDRAHTRQALRSVTRAALPREG